MPLKPINPRVLKRMRDAYAKEIRSTRSRLSPRVSAFFRRLKNIDHRKFEKFSDEQIASIGRQTMRPNYAVRLLRAEGEGIVVKYPTLAHKGFKVSPREEIDFVRNMVREVNKALSKKRGEILQPQAEVVGPFIVTKQVDLPLITNFYSNWKGEINPRAIPMLSKLSRELRISEQEVRDRIEVLGGKISLEARNVLINGKVRISEKYPSGEEIYRKGRNDLLGTSYRLIPLEPRHLFVVGQKDGVIQFVPLIDAI